MTMLQIILISISACMCLISFALAIWSYILRRQAEKLWKKRDELLNDSEDNSEYPFAILDSGISYSSKDNAQNTKTDSNDNTRKLNNSGN